MYSLSFINLKIKYFLSNKMKRIKEKKLIKDTRITFEDKFDKYYENALQGKKYSNENDFILDNFNILEEYANEINKTPEEYKSNSLDLFKPVMEKNIEKIYNKFSMNVGEQDFDANVLFDKEIYKCQKCKSTDFLGLDKYSSVCQTCGHVYTDYLDDTEDALPYGEYISHKKFTYKEVSHFIDTLHKVQNKQIQNIPKSAIQKIKKEASKYQIKDLNQIDKPFMKKLLKNVGLSKYLNNMHTLIYLVWNIEMPKIDSVIEKRIIHDYEYKVLPVYKKVKPDDRSSFLNYHYTAYKMCELYEQDDVLKYFNLPQDEQKIREYDIIWEKICEQLDWEFISTELDA